ncbi:MAG: cadherin domain-containing protein [Gemmataceae bacterium]
MTVRSLSPRARRAATLQVESLERRDLLSATPLPTLLVIADQQDFYYKEYNDTRASLLAAGVPVVVAATTTNVSTPHPGSGQPANSSGAVTPDIALANVNSANYSAIAFVGGWGASMYQYAYNDPNFDGTTDNFYWNAPYNGDANLNDGVIAPQKVVVNQLINQFLAADKPVAAVCHGVTVLAWARVDGVSPLAGRQVSVPLTVGSPNQYYGGAERVYPYLSGQYDQVVANGGLANTVSGQYGNPATVADDVVVDGRIITAENYDSAAYFGTVIAQQVLAALPPANLPPVAQNAVWNVAENSAAGTLVGVVSASDPDAGQTLSYALLAGNTGGAFALDPVTGALTVANPAALDFETQANYALHVRVVDSGNPALDAYATVIVQLSDVYEPATLTAGNLVLHGTAGDDTIYVWSNNATGGVSAWINGSFYGPFQLGPTGQVKIRAGAGNDSVFATDLYVPAMIDAGAGHDKITGGWRNDVLVGGEGIDRLWGGPGDDTILGGDNTDYLYGREGNDVLVGDAGNDILEGFDGRDLLIGGLGSDGLRGDGGEDVLIGGTTSYDNSPMALATLRAIWSGAGDFNTRIGLLSDPLAAHRLIQGDTVQDDGAMDCLFGGADSDWQLASLNDVIYALELSDRLSLA